MPSLMNRGQSTTHFLENSSVDTTRASKGTCLPEKWKEIRMNNLCCFVWRGTKTSGRNAIDRAKGGVEELRPQCVRGAPYYCFYFYILFSTAGSHGFACFFGFCAGPYNAYWVATFLAPMNHEARQLQLKPHALPPPPRSALYAGHCNYHTHTSAS